MSLSRYSTPTNMHMSTPQHTKRLRRAAKLSASAHSPAAATARHTKHRGAPTPHNDDDVDAPLDDTSMYDVPVMVLTHEERKEIIENGRHFSKIASRFAFENTTPAYNGWVIQFKAEIESYGLEHTVSEPPQHDSPLSVLSHKTVYNMILHCVPKLVLPSITVTLSEHSAYEAWRVLRLQYIGDEATYLQGLETRFQRVIWSDGEEFNAFEVRFGQIVSELESAGQLKPDHVKKSVFMHAIESSSKKDVRGVHVFDRLNTTSKIHWEKAFSEWMVHLRVEAQQIHDAIANEVVNRRGTKRTHADHAEQSSREESLPISSISFHNAASHPSASPPNRPPPLHAQRPSRADRPSGVCFNMARSGTCRFGAQCKFSHDASTQVRQVHTNIVNASSRQKQEVCRMFQTGRCRFGDRCRHIHSDASNGGFKQDSYQGARQQLSRIDYYGLEQQQSPIGPSSSLG